MLLGHEIPVEQGGRDRQRMLAVGGAHTRARRHVSPDAMPAHHPLDPLAADDPALGTQLGMNTWCPIPAPMVGVNPPDIGQQFTISGFARALRP